MKLLMKVLCATSLSMTTAFLMSCSSGAVSTQNVVVAPVGNNVGIDNVQAKQGFTIDLKDWFKFNGMEQGQLLFKVKPLAKDSTIYQFDAVGDFAPDQASVFELMSLNVCFMHDLGRRLGYDQMYFLQNTNDKNASVYVGYVKSGETLAKLLKQNPVFKEPEGQLRDFENMRAEPSYLSSPYCRKYQSNFAF